MDRETPTGILVPRGRDENAWKGGAHRRTALILFTKVPRPGLVKTRLISSGGSPSPSDVSSLYVALLEDTLSAVRDLRRTTQTNLVVSFTPEDGELELRRVIGGFADEAEFRPQAGATVTDRVRRAFEDAFVAGYDYVSLIPGDHADLDGALLAEAFDRLTSPLPAVVLGPTSDGGAFLIGFNRPAFAAIKFDLEDTHLVCADVFRRSRAAGITCSFLETRNDIDDWEDARRLLTDKKLGHTRTWRALRQLKIPDGMGSTEAKVSVVVPVLNEEDTIDGLLSSLRRQLEREFEVIVVDGGSRDGTVERVWGKADKVVFVESPSRLGQENVGAFGARGEILLFLHADSTFQPTLIGSVIQSLRDPSVVGGSCRAVFGGEGAKVGFVNAVRLCGSRILGIHGISSGFFVRRSVFVDAGGFREEVMEEAVDLQRRVSSFGRFVTLEEVCTSSARRFNRRGRFLATLVVWVTTVALTALGLHFTSIEKKLWKPSR